MAKIIEGTRANADRLRRGSVTVEVVEDGTRRPLRHVCRHSPDGFEWGYGGSGPADLARSILVEIMGKAALCEVCEGSSWLRYAADETEADRPATPEEIAAGDRGENVSRCYACDGGIVGLPYQSFKSAFVARFPMEGFVLPAAEVEAWLADYMRERAS